ncbi:hypothetical protein [Vogesella sp. XCS3]|jgi:hypothetical protein|uniref:hypothetical protein n=1 Tax=Vogesella sp. XCS3 TaxID=2877939 RepID=UPI001D0B1A12|nr:hypothetical protein [Vogesella sp. XCS3]UDM18134.1 hypothetical protein LCH97_05545 [Vogesella sp. XCS3]
MNKKIWPQVSKCTYPTCLLQDNIPEYCMTAFQQADTHALNTACRVAQVNHLYTTQIRMQTRLFDGDLIKAYLLSEISSRHPVAQALPTMAAEAYAFSNIHSLSEATGYPRETVRRKILQMIESGWVTRLDNGGLLVNHEKQASYHQILLAQASLITQTAAKLDRLRSTTITAGT